MPAEVDLGLHALLAALGELLEHGLFGGLKHAVEEAQHGEGEDHPAILGLLEIIAEEIRDGPDKR